MKRLRIRTEPLRLGLSYGDLGDPSLSDQEQRIREDKKARRAADKAMRYIEPLRSDQLLRYDRYWNLQILLALIAEVDRANCENPRGAVLLAQRLPELARRIRINRGCGTYVDRNEKADFIILTKAVLSSAYVYSGSVDHAAAECKAFMPELEGRSRYVVADAFRRASRVYGELGEFSEARLLCSRAAQLFGEEGRTDMEALSRLRLGTIRYADPDEQSSEAGAEDYIAAVELGSALTIPRRKTWVSRTCLPIRREIRNRGRRVALAGMMNLLRLFENRGTGISDTELHSRISSLRGHMKGMPSGEMKAKALWLNALVLARSATYRLSERHLSRALVQLLSSSCSPSDIAACVADLILLPVKLAETEELPRVLRACEAAILDAIEATASDRATLELLAKWTSSLHAQSLTAAQVELRARELRTAALGGQKLKGLLRGES